MAHPLEASDARRVAIVDVQRILQHPDDFQKLPALRQEYNLRQQASKSALNAAVLARVELTRSGVALIQSALEAIRKLREDFQDIDMLCTECSSLIESHDKIQLLSEVHVNIQSTLQEVDNMERLPREAEAVQALLDEEAPLIDVYERLVVLESTSIKAQAALEKVAAHINLKDIKDLNAYFQRVRAVLSRFEERLWSIIRMFLPLSRSKPGLLVDALQVIELQDGIDTQLIQSGQVEHPLRKAWRRRCMGQLSMSIQDRFSPLLARCSQLVAAGENTNKQVTSILESSDTFLNELPDICEFVQPCFPPPYNIISFFMDEYHSQLSSTLDFIGLCADNLANEDILQIVAWVGRAVGLFKDLGVTDQLADFSMLPGSGLALLTDKYVERVSATLSSWLSNIVRDDYRGPPKFSGDGRAWTPGPVDFFRILNEQLGVVAAVDSDGALALAVGQASLDAMRRYQAAQRTAVAPGTALPLDMLAAAVNNSLRCYDESVAFAEGVQARLSRRLRGQLDFEGAGQGFQDTARHAVRAVVRLVLADPGVVGLFLQIGCSLNWQNGSILGSILATLEDYLGDLEVLLKPDAVLQFVEAAANETIQRYCASLLCFLSLVGDDEVAALRRDHGRLVEFFSRHLKPLSKAQHACQPLAEMAEFLGADSLDGFVLAYGSLISMTPGLTPTLLNGLLVARVAAGRDFTRSDAKEVLEECREVYASRQLEAASINNGGDHHKDDGTELLAEALASKPASSREAALYTALAALRKAPVHDDQGA